MKSFNQADTTISVIKGGRLVINSDIKRRMRMVVNTFTFLSLSRDQRMVPMFELLEHVQQQDTTHSYSRADIMYAVRRCMAEGLVVNPSWGVYQLTLDPKVARTTIR